MRRLVIADTSPINYLLLIGHIGILPALFERVILPAAVWDELKHPKAPAAVKNWIAAPPDWVDVRRTSHLPELHLKRSMPVRKLQSPLQSSCGPICC